MAEVTFTLGPDADSETAADALHLVASAWRMNGQKYEQEYPVRLTDRALTTWVMVPEPTSLDALYANDYVASAIAKFPAACIVGMAVTAVHPDAWGQDACDCGPAAPLLLATSYTRTESPLQCLKCLHPVPLYRIPPTYNDEYWDILCWQTAYQACDDLNMGCGALERAAMRELSRLDSSLSQRGIEICQKITEATGLPVYYNLFRYRGRSLKQELARRCPGCGGAWLLEEPWEDFNFRCDRCRLLSNVAWNVRHLLKV